MARKDPYQNFRYLVEIDGIAQAGFSEATIPDSAQDPIGAAARRMRML